MDTRLAAAAARGLTKFVGRDRELESLSRALDKVESGTGQVIGSRRRGRRWQIEAALELRAYAWTGRYISVWKVTVFILAVRWPICLFSMC